MKKKVNAYLCLAFILLFLLQCMQMSKVYLYFDDFGYASLSYVGLTDNKGLSYSIFEVFEFLKNHYFYWGGRVFWFFWLIIFIKNIWLIRIIQAVIIVSIFFLIYKISSIRHEKLSCLIVCFPMILFATLPLEIVSDAVYWFTASILYLFPLPFLILGLKMFYNVSMNKKKCIKKKNIVAMCLILFCASFSQEQISTACLGGVIFIICISWEKAKRINIGQVCGLITTIVGFLLLALCPGNAMRIQRLGIHLSIIQNFGDLAKLLGSGITIKYMLILLMCVLIVNCMIVYCNMRKTGGIIKGYFVLHIIITSLLLLLLCIKRIGLYWLMYSFTNKDSLAVVLLWLYLLSVVINVCFYYWNIDDKLLLTYWGAAVMSIALLVISGSVSNRTLFPFLILSFIFIIDIVCRFMENIKSRQLKAVFNIVILTLSLYASYNWCSIYRGYALNAPIHKSNDLILSQYRGSKDVKTIILQKESNDRYGHIMPYFEGWEVIDDYYRAYYDLPSSCKLMWK